MIYISFDLDYVTGDCRAGHQMHYCAWRCPGCGEHDGPGRAQGKPRPDALLQFAKMRNWLTTLNIIQPVIVRDCHADILAWLQSGDTVLNFDAHSDDKPVRFGVIDCGNWVTSARNNGIMVEQMCYIPLPYLFEPVRLFIAVSIPYTSPVCDEALIDMLCAAGSVDWDLSERLRDEVRG